MDSTITRYVPMTDSKERLRPILQAIIENQHPDNAADMILKLIDVPERRSISVAEEPCRRSLETPAPPPPASASASVAATPAKPVLPNVAPSAASSPAASSVKRPVTRDEFYSVEDSAAFLDITTAAMYAILNREPAENFPFQMASSGSPHGRRDRKMLMGRGLVDYKARRTKKPATQNGLDHKDHSTQGRNENEKENEEGRDPPEHGEDDDDGATGLKVDY
jgi:hypothetical protein